MRSCGFSFSYIYDATGTKLQKTGGSSVTDYAGNYVYQGTSGNETLQFFNQPEGYVTPDGMGGHDYVYQYKDHLGNIRLSYTDNNGNLEIIEENNYYPFGLRHKGYNNVVNGTHHPYTYNGKEEQEELELDWLDYGARNYDAALGRLLNIDRYAEKFEALSPYQYANNNPIYFIDVNGEYIYIHDGDNTYRYHNGATQYKDENGKWVNADKNTKLSDYAIGTIARIQQLENSGNTGSNLVGFFKGMENDVTINKAKSNWSTFSNIGFKLNAATKTPTTKGILSSPDFVSLGHELAHIQDKRTRGQEIAAREWYKIDDEKISVSEIYASHIENQIRSDSGLPLRTHYSTLVGILNGHVTETGDERSRLVDLKGNSKYYNSQNQAIQPMPSISKQPYDGEIFRNRFNYTNPTLQLATKSLKN